VNCVSNFMGKYRSILDDNLRQHVVYVIYRIFMGKGYFHKNFDLWFTDLYNHWRTRLFSILVILEDKVVLKFW
jgi:hypothetical protein